MRLFRRMLWGLALAGLSACSQIPANLKTGFSPSDATGAKVSTAESKPSPTGDEAEKAPLKADLSQIIHMLEDGRQDQARVALKAYRAKDPKNPLALSLQQQLDTNPISMLGKPATTYTVQPGDTLGGLAERFLGNSSKFVILARYNHIARSKDLRVGQVIRLPASATPAEASATPNGAGSSDASPPMDHPGMPNEKSAQDQDLNPVNAREPQPPADEQTSKPDAKSLLLVQKYHKQALAAYRRQNLDQAIALWNKALAIDPNYEPALGYRARALELKKRLHQLEGGTH